MSRTEIKTLTPEQEAEIPAYIEKWLAIAKEPTDHDRQADAVAALYASNGDTPPAIVFTPSPGAAVREAARLLVEREGMEPQAARKKAAGDSYSSVWWLSRAGWYDFAQHIGVEFDADKYKLFMDFVRGVQFCVPYDEVCVVADNPVAIRWDEDNNLHNEEGLAVEYSDGWGLYCWHGVTVPEKLIMRPDEVTREEIVAEENAEVRRAYASKLQGRFGELLGLEVIDTHEYDDGRKATLQRTKEKDDLVGDFLYYAGVVCPSTDRAYLLPVPPMDDAWEAVAWTFGMTGEDYRPEVET